MCTLNDDLFGTRARGNQVTTISNRKADQEGHNCDVIVDALFRFVMKLGFRRLAEFQVDKVKKIAIIHTRTPR